MASDGAGDTIQAVTVEMSRLVAPIGEAATAASDGSPEQLELLIEDMGVAEELEGEQYDEIRTVIESVGGPWSTIQKNAITPIRNEEVPGPEQIKAAVEAVGTLFENLQDLSGMSPPGGDAAASLADLLVDYLIAEYLERHRPKVYSLFCMSDVIVNERSGAPTEIDLSRFPELAQNPKTIPGEVLDWGKPGFRAYVVVHYVGRFLSNVIPASATEPADVFEAGKNADNPALGTQLDAPFLSTEVGGAVLVLGSKLVPVPGHGNKHPGLGLFPYAAGSFDKTYDLGGNWELRTEIGAAIKDWMLVAQPTQSGDTDVGIRVLDGELPVKADQDMLPPDDSKVSTVGLPDLHAEAELAHAGGESGRTLVMGDPESGGLYLTNVSVKGILDAADDGPSFAVELPVRAELDVKPEGGFVSKVLPEEFGSDFELSVGYAVTKGFYVDAGATLEFPIPVNESLGPITLKEIYLALSLTTDPEEGEAPITLTGAASASVTLGPIVGTVDRIGIEADVSFPGDNDGNFGPVQIDLGFKPPRGAGLAIAAGSAVKGGGYLFYDDEKERYGGTAQLKVPGGLTLSAVGLLTTRMPDGSEGFSLFVMIAGEFSPVPIGAGFTLNGVGGMLGINRRFKKEALRKVVRQGNLQSVLFPENVVENAKQIISDIRRMFPPKRGTHIFGPMVKIGYGSPTTVEFSLGIVLEIPSFRIVVLGRMEVGLPGVDVPRPPGTPKEVPWPQVKLNLDVAGILDIPGKELSIDAFLYDSHVLMWSIKGGMALRAKWGQQSQFLISIGGFHPAYPPPKNVPDLDRLTVALDVPGGNPTVTFKGYMAVTSNTFQVGAKVHAEIDKGKLFASGTLGFDALFQFKPFKFRFDFLVQFRIEIGKFKLGAGIDGTVTGPSPMRIRGKAHLNPPGLPKMKAKFDVTLGKDTGSSELPAAEVIPPLVDALTHDKNWEAQLPDDGEGPISLRGAGKRAKKAAKQSGGQGSGGEDSGPMRAHPLGTLTVTQGVVPFSYTIEKFGESSPGIFNRFAITDVKVGGESADVTHESVSGEFAPAKYKKMGTKEKLNSKDFVEREAGTTVGTSEVFAGGETTPKNATHARFIYEEQVYDRERDKRGADVAGKHAKQGHTEHVAKRQTKGKASAQTETKGRFSVSEDGTGDGSVGPGGAGGGVFGTGNREFVVVDPRTFERVDEDLVVGLMDTGDGGDAAPSEPQDYRTTTDGVFGPETGGIDGDRGLPRNAAEDARRQIAADMGRDPADLSVVALDEYAKGVGE